MKNILNTISGFFRRKSKKEKKFSGKLAYLNDIPTINVTGSIDLLELIGKTITNVRQDFAFNKIGGWMDYSSSFFTIDNRFDIHFLYSGTWTASIVNTPANAKQPPKEFIDKIVGHKIAAIYFDFYENEPDSGQPNYIELDNSFVLSESNIAPHGTGAADLIIYTPEEFKEMIDDPERDIRSIQLIG